MPEGYHESFEAMDNNTDNANVLPGTLLIPNWPGKTPASHGEATAVRCHGSALVAIDGFAAIETARAAAATCQVNVIDPAQTLSKEALLHTGSWSQVAKAALIARLIKAFESESPLSWGRKALFTSVGLDDRNYRRIIKVIGSGRQDLISALEAGSTTPTDAELLASKRAQGGSYSAEAEMAIEEVPLDSIDLAAGTQARLRLDQEAIKDYAGLYEKDPGLLPPVRLVKPQSGKYLPGDAFHRIEGSRQAGLKSILAIVMDGTLKDAQWLAAGANHAHGVRLSCEDKRRAVKLALQARPESSDRQIGEHVGVDHKTVAAVRAESTGEIPQSAYRIGLDGKARPVARKAKVEKTQACKDAADDHDGKEGSSEEASGSSVKAEVAPASGTPQDAEAESAQQLSAQALEALLWILPQLGRAVPPFERATILAAIGDRVTRAELERCLGWASPNYNPEAGS